MTLQLNFKPTHENLLTMTTQFETIPPTLEIVGDLTTKEQQAISEIFEIVPYLRSDLILSYLKKNHLALSGQIINCNTLACLPAHCKLKFYKCDKVTAQISSDTPIAVINLF